MGKFKNSLIVDSECGETIELEQVSFIGMIDLFKTIQSDRLTHKNHEQEELDANYVSPDQLPLTKIDLHCAPLKKVKLSPKQS